jgi:toxin ParE1/3/4
MAWKVIFSERSKVDLEKIVEFIARDDPAAAERFGLALIDKAEALAQAPKIGPLLPQKQSVRFLPFGAYLIIYRPDEARRVVRILRFWHSARRARPTR